MHNNPVKVFSRSSLTSRCVSNGHQIRRLEAGSAGSVRKWIRSPIQRLKLSEEIAICTANRPFGRNSGGRHIESNWLPLLVRRKAVVMGFHCQLSGEKTEMIGPHSQPKTLVCGCRTDQYLSGLIDRMAFILRPRHTWIERDLDDANGRLLEILDLRNYVVLRSACHDI
jgi:hypothetical protein